MLPVKFLSAIIENKDKTFSGFKRINSDTIIIKLSDDTDVKVYDPDLDVIKSVKLNQRFRNTIEVEVEDYFFYINYSYDPPRVSKKHKDLKIYSDLEPILEIMADNDVKEMKHIDDKILFTFSNDNELEYKVEQFDLKLLDMKINGNEIILHFTKGIYAFVKHQNDYHFFKLASSELNFENKIRGFSFEDIEKKCSELPISSCTNSFFKSDFKNKKVAYDTKNLCRVKDDQCVMRENLEDMNFSYLDFNF